MQPQFICSMLFLIHYELVDLRVSFCTEVRLMEQQSGSAPPSKGTLAKVSPLFLAHFPQLFDNMHFYSSSCCGMFVLLFRTVSRFWVLSFYLGRSKELSRTSLIKWIFPILLYLWQSFGVPWKLLLGGPGRPHISKLPGTISNCLGSEPLVPFSHLVAFQLVVE